MKTKISILLVVLAIHQLSSAGQERGNGGDAVVCYQPGFKDAVIRDTSKITSIELLDIYEGRVLKGMQFDVSPETDYLSIARQKIAKLKLLSPLRFLNYSKALENFTQEMIDPNGIQLTDVDDSKHITIPVNCKIEQLVIQKIPEFPDEKRYTIDGDLWSLMNADQRAATVTHELIYGELLNSADSRGVRHLNSLLNSRNFSNMTGNLWFVHQHWSKVSFIEFEKLIFLRGLRSMQPNPQQPYTYRSVLNEELVKAGYPPQDFNTAFQGLIKGMAQAEIEGTCSFTECKINVLRAWQAKGLELSKTNYLNDLNVSRDLRLYFIEFDSQMQLRNAQLGFFELSPFQVEFQNYVIKSNGRPLMIQKSSNSKWIPSPLNYREIVKEELEIQGHPGTSKMKLELGEFKIMYVDGKSSTFSVENANLIVEEGVLGFKSNGLIGWLYLGGLKVFKKHNILFNDGKNWDICGGEKIEFNDLAQPLFNQNWRKLNPGPTNECFGTP